MVNVGELWIENPYDCIVVAPVFRFTLVENISTVSSGFIFLIHNMKWQRLIVIGTRVTGLSNIFYNCIEEKCIATIIIVISQLAQVSQDRCPLKPPKNGGITEECIIHHPWQAQHFHMCRSWLSGLLNIIAKNYFTDVVDGIKISLLHLFWPEIWSSVDILLAVIP